MDGLQSWSHKIQSRPSVQLVTSNIQVELVPFGTHDSICATTKKLVPVAKTFDRTRIRRIPRSAPVTASTVAQEKSNPQFQLDTV
jgi:hypothetical protein